MGTSDFDELKARTTIGFDHPVMYNELKSIFGYVAEMAGYEFDSSAKMYLRIGNKFIESPQEHQFMRQEDYVDSVQGTVTSQHQGSAQFVCDAKKNYEHGLGPQAYFTKIEFLTTPGYDSVAELEGMMADSLNVMDTVRTHVTAYFEYKAKELPQKI